MQRSCGKVWSVCVTKEGKIVSGSADKTVRVWDMKGKELAVCRGHEDQVESVCVTNYGKIVSGSLDGTVRVWEIEGKQLAVCRCLEDMVYSIGVMDDGKIVSCSRNKAVYVWDISLLARIKSMDRDTARVVWEVLRSASLQAEIDKQELWKEIEKILAE